MTTIKKERCIIIPAIKKNAVIPDQLVKRLNGVTLIQRALNTAKTLLQGEDIYVVTDSEEISLICQRNGVCYHYEQSLRFNSSNILRELKFFIEKQTVHYNHILIYRATSPLVDHKDIQQGYNIFLNEDADILVTLKKQEHRIWKEVNGHPEQLFFGEETEPILIEVKSLLIVKSSAVNSNSAKLKIIPFYLGDKAIEISCYQDWWICEKLLKQKRIVFVVTGYPAVGLGHVYRALTLAHDITDHRVLFLCTKESELAIKGITEKDYMTVLQSGALLEDVLKMEPDLVVNDFLDTDYEYVAALKGRGIKVVNFEDSGPGVDAADLVVSALYYQNDELPDKYLYGPKYFCLRDEFIDAEKRKFHKKVRNLLITFGGTDPGNLTLQVLHSVQDICEQKSIKIFIVTGPGYLHKVQLLTCLQNMTYRNFEYIHKTGIMSSIMEKADLAISSAGRTVYELAHMRVPAIIMSQHAREHTHAFARPENGFEYIGIMDAFNSVLLKDSFIKILESNYRRSLYERMKTFNFAQNKRRVTKKILSLLEEG